MMKENAILINAARGPVIDEVALVKHLKKNPKFGAGLDVFEDEPLMKPGLADCDNAVLLPHIASASLWTRSGKPVTKKLFKKRMVKGWRRWQLVM